MVRSGLISVDWKLIGGACPKTSAGTIMAKSMDQADAQGRFMRASLAYRAGQRHSDVAQPRSLSPRRSAQQSMADNEGCPFAQDSYPSSVAPTRANPRC